MPTYVYRREDGSTFEIEQRITEEALTTCPTTGQQVRRVITGGTGLIFKGSGFYLTDYARNNGNGKKEEKTPKTGDPAAANPSEAPSSETSSTPKSTDTSE